ncbi:amidase [Aliishimia ponticola]|uniref:Amidase n=1 Tax=Aliishimia ponticola TaxID=2499833 RepID=A0A4S4NB69_9RHOB|nr:amidase family protein [Aliishimia ponticola]THH36634.1 amidase [Aliishimia ponticola]
MVEWQGKSAAELGRGIAAGQVDPVELTSAYLETAEAHPQSGRIYARLTPDRALAEAHAARGRARTGMRLSALDGVPISWKDLFDTAGIVTEAGSLLLEGRVPTRDARVLQSATAMGLVCLGKTHMSELAFSGLGYNPSTETSPNINDAGAVPGGSSSGAAASVAFGLAPAAIGSDTGGSVRLPAAWNDLVGLKTTHDRLSLDGVVPLCLRFDTVGPLTRTVEDAALLLAAMEGTVAPDLGGASLRGARLAVLETIALEDVRDAPGTAFDDAVRRLEAAGATIQRIKVPELAEAMGFGGSLYTAEAYGLWKDVIEAAPDKMFAEVLTRFRLGGEVSASDYVARWRRLADIRAAYAAATAGFDAVLVPTAASLPPELARLQTDSDYFIAENLLALRNTRIGNLMGLCGLTLPTGVPSCGIQLMAGPGQDVRLLRLGAAAEAALA